MMKMKKSKMERVPGHSSVLHSSVSSRSGQEAPAFFASLITSRPLFLVPPPQVTLHLPHGFQSPTLQSTGNVKLWWEIKEPTFAKVATMIASHFQITMDCGARALSRMLLVMMMIFLTLGFPFELDRDYQLQRRQQQGWLQWWRGICDFFPTFQFFARFFPHSCTEAPENKKDFTCSVK